MVCGRWPAAASTRWRPRRGCFILWRIAVLRPSHDVEVEPRLHIAARVVAIVACRQIAPVPRSIHRRRDKLCMAAGFQYTHFVQSATGLHPHLQVYLAAAAHPVWKMRRVGGPGCRFDRYRVTPLGKCTAIGTCGEHLARGRGVPSQACHDIVILRTARGIGLQPAACSRARGIAVRLLQAGGQREQRWQKCGPSRVRRHGHSRYEASKRGCIHDGVTSIHAWRGSAVALSCVVVFRQRALAQRLRIGRLLAGVPDVQRHHSHQ